MSRLAGNTIIVTGGAQGIGRAFCEALAGEGASVVVADIDGDLAGRVAKDLEAQGHQALAVETDVSRAESVDRLTGQTIDRFGRVDGLINNAAVFQRPAMARLPIEKVSLEEWDRLMAVNLRGVFLCCRSVVPHMKRQQRGKIVNISSGTVFYGTPFTVHYVASKAGVIGMTRCLARELGEYGITVNSVAPGLTISTEQVDAARDEYNKRRMQARSIKRTMYPQDLVGAAVFFCSQESDFITGQTLIVDGGALMH